MPITPTPKIWMNGDLVDWADAKVHVLTHTLHYGMGVFEGVRAYKTDKGTAIFRLHEHTNRLFNSAHIMNMSIPFSKDIINEAAFTNHLFLHPLIKFGLLDTHDSFSRPDPIVRNGIDRIFQQIPKGSVGNSGIFCQFRNLEIFFFHHLRIYLRF